MEECAKSPNFREQSSNILEFPGHVAPPGSTSDQNRKCVNIQFPLISRILKHFSHVSASMSLIHCLSLKEFEVSASQFLFMKWAVTVMKDSVALVCSLYSL